jgi:hypothetical protein
LSEDALVTGALPGFEESRSETVGKDDDLTPTGRVKKPRGRAAVKIRMESLEIELQDRIREYVAVPIGMVSPLGCAVLDARAERTSKALCRIAATSPAMRRALERFVQGSAVVDVAATGIAVMIAIGVDLGRFEPTSMPAQFAGIPDLWMQIYPEESMFARRNGKNAEPDFRGDFLGNDDEPVTEN